MVRGQLDLRDWNPATKPQLALAGDWAFYWGHLVGPIELATGMYRPTGHYPVPSSWTDYQVNGQPLPDRGAATYVLTVRLPQTETALALQVPFVWSSYRVWVNGHLEGESGRPGLTAEATRSVFLKSFIPLPEDVQTVVIVVQVADHESGTPGLLETPVIGTRASLLAQRDFRNALNMAIIGALLVLAAYHLFFYAFRRKETAMLAFALICLAVVVRFAVFGDHHVFEWLMRYSGLLTFSEQGRIYYTATFWLGVLGLFYLRALFPLDVWRRAPQIAAGAGVLVIGLALVLDFAHFAMVLPVFLAVLGAIVAYAVYVMVRAAWLDRQQARLLLVGLGGMILAGVHDALATAGVYLISETELLTYGFLFFIFVQFVVVARRFSTTYAAVEDLSENLERKVEQRTAELAAANLEIQQKNEDITDSIEYAKRIQLSILPDVGQLSERLPQSFIHYAPKDIVSGDFYWYHVAEDGTLTVAVADATGHGVPGAFMSVLGINLLSRAMHEAPQADPALLLTLLHSWVRQALKQDQARDGSDRSEDGMEMALVQLLPSGELLYAGANRPLLRHRGDELSEFNPIKHAIGGSDVHGGGTAVFSTQRLEVQPGDLYYLFTDGATDQFGGEGEHRRRFSKQRFRTLLSKIAQLPVARQRERLATTLADWQGAAPQTDDILILGFRIAG